MSKKPTKKYSEMSSAQLDKIAAKFDREFIADEATPLTGELRKRHESARKRGRPRIGQGSKRVLVTVEAGLLSRTDAFVKRHGLTRAQAVAQGLRMLLSSRRRVG